VLRSVCRTFIPPKKKKKKSNKQTNKQTDKQPGKQSNRTAVREKAVHSQKKKNTKEKKTIGQTIIKMIASRKCFNFTTS
jgi:DeoR/GlpR family transcriptional regulator of sugar metabolism